MSAHPVQRVVREGTVIRFRANNIVADVFAGRCPADMNVIGSRGYKKSDLEQLAQLLGYSVAGFADLSYASPRVIRAADEAVLDLLEAEKERDRK